MSTVSIQDKEEGRVQTSPGVALHMGREVLQSETSRAQHSNDSSGGGDRGDRGHREEEGLPSRPPPRPSARPLLSSQHWLSSSGNVGVGIALLKELLT